MPALGESTLSASLCVSPSILSSLTMCLKLLFLRVFLRLSVCLPVFDKRLSPCLLPSALLCAACLRLSTLPSACLSSEQQFVYQHVLMCCMFDLLLLLLLLFLLCVLSGGRANSSAPNFGGLLLPLPSVCGTAQTRLWLRCIRTSGPTQLPQTPLASLGTWLSSLKNCSSSCSSQSETRDSLLRGLSQP